MTKPTGPDHPSGRNVRHGHEFIDMGGVQIAKHADDHARIDVVAEPLASLRLSHRDQSTPSVTMKFTVSIVWQVAVRRSNDVSIPVTNGHGGCRPDSTDGHRTREWNHAGRTRSTRPSGRPRDTIASEAASAVSRSARKTSQVSKR